MLGFCQVRQQTRRELYFFIGNYFGCVKLNIRGNKFHFSIFGLYCLRQINLIALLECVVYFVLFCKEGLRPSNHSTEVAH